MEEIYRQNAKLVYYFLYAKCKNAALAEDLTSETFLQAMKSIDRYDGTCKMSVWLCQIAKHLLYQYWEKHKKEVFLEDDWTIADETDFEKELLTRYELLDALREVNALPDNMRKVMYLRISGELSFREIGTMLGKSENWARVNFFRAKEIVKEKLGKGGSYGQIEL